MAAPTCALCGAGLNNTSHKLQFLRLAYTEMPERDNRWLMLRVVVNCYTHRQHYKKWVPFEILLSQIKAEEIGGRNIDVDPENEMADVILHLGGKPLIRRETNIGLDEGTEAIV